MKFLLGTTLTWCTASNQVHDFAHNQDLAFPFSWVEVFVEVCEMQSMQPADSEEWKIRWTQILLFENPGGVIFVWCLLRCICACLFEISNLDSYGLKWSWFCIEKVDVVKWILKNVCSMDIRVAGIECRCCEVDFEERVFNGYKSCRHWV